MSTNCSLKLGEDAERHVVPVVLPPVHKRLPNLHEGGNDRKGKGGGKRVLAQVFFTCFGLEKPGKGARFSIV